MKRSPFNRHRRRTSLKTTLFLFFILCSCTNVRYIRTSPNGEIVETNFRSFATRTTGEKVETDEFAYESVMKDEGSSFESFINSLERWGEAWVAASMLKNASDNETVRSTTVTKEAANVDKVQIRGNTQQALSNDATDKLRIITDQ